MADTLFEPEYLDYLYTHWRIADRKNLNPDFVPTKWDLKMSYLLQHRNGFTEQRFESWLYAQGFTVIQNQSKRYLKFSGNEKYLTMFLLKYPRQQTSGSY